MLVTEKGTRLLNGERPKALGGGHTHSDSLPKACLRRGELFPRRRQPGRGITQPRTRSLLRPPFFDPSFPLSVDVNYACPLARTEDRRTAFKCNPRPSLQSSRCRKSTAACMAEPETTKKIPLCKLQQTLACRKNLGTSPKAHKTAKCRWPARPSLRVFVPPSIDLALKSEAIKYLNGRGLRPLFYKGYLIGA